MAGDSVSLLGWHAETRQGPAAKTEAAVVRQPVELKRSRTSHSHDVKHVAMKHVAKALATAADATFNST